MTKRDKIESLEHAITDAEDAQRDKDYQTLYPIEHAGLAAFIRDCRRQLRELDKD